jgi:hypothetical protein
MFIGKYGMQGEHLNTSYDHLTIIFGVGVPYDEGDLSF